jgi:hypothetical protein
METHKPQEPDPRLVELVAEWFGLPATLDGRRISRPMAGIAYLVGMRHLHEIALNLRQAQSPIETELLAAICWEGTYRCFGVRTADGHVLIPSAADPIHACGWITIEVQPELVGIHPDLRITLERPGKALRAVLVECDGHDFHERTKDQAARDKKRDRNLATAGWTTLRFTGSEIYADPLKCASDVVEYLLRAAER